MSFSEKSSFGGWKNIGCFLLGLLLGIGNTLFLIMWYFTLYDTSTDTYRSLVMLDLFVPTVLLASAAMLWLYIRFVMRDKN